MELLSKRAQAISEEMFGTRYEKEKHGEIHLFSLKKSFLSEIRATIEKDEKAWFAIKECISYLSKGRGMVSFVGDMNLLYKKQTKEQNIILTLLLEEIVLNIPYEYFSSFLTLTHSYPEISEEITTSDKMRDRLCNVSNFL
jgi:hypothetical protein